MVKEYNVTLDDGERKRLQDITRKGKHNSQEVLNALILLNCEEGEFQDSKMKNEDVSSVLKISMSKIDRVKKKIRRRRFGDDLTRQKNG